MEETSISTTEEAGYIPFSFSSAELGKLVKYAAEGDKLWRYGYLAIPFDTWKDWGRPLRLEVRHPRLYRQT